MKTVLFTGGAGFIGSNIVDKYIELGNRVIVVDDLSSGCMNNLENVINSPLLSFEKVDITDYEALEKVFNKYRPSVINHHAAQKSVSYSVEDPLHNAMVNEIGVLNLIELTKKYPIERFIYVSSGGALAKDLKESEKSKETDIPQLESPYSITKYIGEQYLRLYSKLYNFSWIGLRYANVYGPRQIPDGECGVIPIFVGNILNNKESVLFTYSDLPRGCIRDYVNVKDVVEFNVLALNSTTGLNDFYNIGCGEGIQILDIYEKLQVAFKTTIGIKITGPRLGDIKRSILDTTKAKKVFGWEPKVKLEEGLLELVQVETK